MKSPLLIAVLFFAVWNDQDARQRAEVVKALRSAPGITSLARKREIAESLVTIAVSATSQIVDPKSNGRANDAIGTLVDAGSNEAYGGAHFEWALDYLMRIQREARDPYRHSNFLGILAVHFGPERVLPLVADVMAADDPGAREAGRLLMTYAETGRADALQLLRRLFESGSVKNAIVKRDLQIYATGRGWGGVAWPVARQFSPRRAARAVATIAESPRKWCSHQRLLPFARRA
jgi:hypothetical protein